MWFASEDAWLVTNVTSVKEYGLRREDSRSQGVLVADLGGDDDDAGL